MQKDLCACSPASESMCGRAASIDSIPVWILESIEVTSTLRCAWGFNGRNGPPGDDGMLTALCGVEIVSPPPPTLEELLLLTEGETASTRGAVIRPPPSLGVDGLWRLTGVLLLLDGLHSMACCPLWLLCDGGFRFGSLGVERGVCKPPPEAPGTPPPVSGPPIELRIAGGGAADSEGEARRGGGGGLLLLLLLLLLPPSL